MPRCGGPFFCVKAPGRCNALRLVDARKNKIVAIFVTKSAKLQLNKFAKGAKINLINKNDPAGKIKKRR